MQRALLLFLIAASYLMFGGTPRWTLTPLLVVAALGVLVAPRRTLWFPRAWRPLDLSLIALMLGLAFQVVPLPNAVAGILSPHAHELRSSLHLPTIGRDAAAWTPLTLDTLSTLCALATVVLGVLSFWIARGIFSAGGSTRQFCRGLALLGTLAAMSAVIFRATEPTMVLGLLEPSARSASPFGAFVNRNHFGAWLLLIVTPVCGYLVAHLRIHPSHRGHWQSRFKEFLASGATLTALAVFCIVGVLFLTLSRSALTGLGTAALAGWYLGRHRLRLEHASLRIVLVVAGAALVMAVLFVDMEGWASRVQQGLGGQADPRDRLTIWRETLPVVRNFWATGTGAGTFAEAMAHYQQSRIWIGAMGKWALFNNAHSHYFQVASEGGLLITVPAMSAALWLLLLGRRAIKDDRGEMFWMRVGAGAGLAGVAVQSIWEVPLIMPANAILFGALAGLLLYQRHGAVLESPSTNSLGAAPSARNSR